MVYKSLLLLTAVISILLAGTRANGRSHQSNFLHFIENKGQIVNQYQEPRTDIDVKLQAGNGLNIFIGAGTIHYQWVRPVATTKAASLIEATEPRPEAYELYRMDMQLIGADPGAVPLLEERQHFFERYFQPWINKDDSNAGVQAFAYKKLTYKNIYPNIDWVFYFNQAGQLEHDFVVHPGGKVSDIKLKYGGAGTLDINKDGGLTATTPMGTITESAPYSFQQDGQVIASRFVLQDDVLSFQVDDYNGTLTIDPTLEWGTYFGGLGTDMGYGLTHDSIGNVYMDGIASSAENIATTGSYQQTIAGSADAFISKFNDDGLLIWATYFGGTMDDRATDIKYDSFSSDLYIAGVTQSDAGIATPGSHQPIHGGSYDAFLARFDTSGQRVWSTYYGGSGADGSSLVAGVTCDGAGNCFLTSETSSNDNIATPNAHQATRTSGTDGFLAKFDATGQRVWGTYLGGGSDDYARKAGCDSAGNVYLGGYTSSVTGITTAGVFQEDFSGVNDIFLAKFDADGSLSWASYFGGSGMEIFNAIAVMADGTCYIAGNTGSASEISTPGVSQVEIGGALDAFLAAFSATGQRIWATYYGGSGADVANALTYDATGIYIGGMSNSEDSISFGNSYESSFEGVFDGFISKINLSGQAIWGSYYGGTDVDFVNGISITPMSQLFVTGQTNSATHIATPEAYQASLGGGSEDAYLIKFNVCEQPPTPLSLTGNTLICEGGSYIYTTDSVAGAIAYQWILPSGWSGSSDSTSITVTPGANTGNIAVVALNSCASSDTLNLDITVNPAPIPVIQQEDNVLSTTQGFTSYQWIRDGEDLTGATQATYTAIDTGMYAVRVTNEEGCTGTSTALAVGSTGMAELEALSRAISVYPNPASNIVQIQSPIRVKVIVSSIEGKRLLLADGVSRLDLSQLAAGMYLLQVYDGDGRLLKTEKLVKEAN